MYRSSRQKTENCPLPHFLFIGRWCHRFSTATVPAIACKLRELACVVAISAAVFFAVRCREKLLQQKRTGFGSHHVLKSCELPKDSGGMSVLKLVIRHGRVRTQRRCTATSSIV